MQSFSRPHTVTILGFNHALSSALTGALDIFALAGVSWQRIHGHQLNLGFMFSSLHLMDFLLPVPIS